MKLKGLVTFTPKLEHDRIGWKYGWVSWSSEEIGLVGCIVELIEI